MSDTPHVRIADQTILIGRYYPKENGDLSVDLSLNADGTATDVISMGPEGDGFSAVGFWDVRGDTVHLHARPGAA